MDLQVTKEFNTLVRRSAAASTIFLNRVVLFGGIPHEDDVDSATPEPIEDLDFAFGLNKNRKTDRLSPAGTLKFTNELHGRESASSKGDSLQSEYFKRLRLASSPTPTENTGELNQTLETSQQLATCSQGTFPSIASRSPLFVMMRTEENGEPDFVSSSRSFTWKYVSATLLQPWSRHGHFLLVDPFLTNRLRILGGRHWHIGDEAPEKDLIFEMSENNNGLAKWIEESPPVGFPSSLFSAAVATTATTTTTANSKNVDEGTSERTIAFTFGGMLANRTFTNAVYKIHVTRSNSHRSTCWKATRLSNTTGTRPAPQFKGVCCLVDWDDKGEPRLLLTFDGFVGKTNVPPNVHELDLSTQVWRHVCMSTPVARAIGLRFCRGRYLAIHGGHRTAAPVKRLGSFVVFDLKLQKWIGLNTSDNRRELMLGRKTKNGQEEPDDDENRSVPVLIGAIRKPRSAHCGLVLLSSGSSKEAFTYYFGGEQGHDEHQEEQERAMIFSGSDERTKVEDDDGMIVVSVVNDGEDPVEFEMMLSEMQQVQASDSATTAATTTTTTTTTTTLTATASSSNDQIIRIPAPDALVKQYQEMLKRAGDTGNGGEPVGTVMFCEFSRKLFPSTSPSYLLTELCAEFLGQQQDELLEDLF